VKLKATGILFKRIKRNITASPYLHVAATGSITFALVIVGVFSLLFVNINKAINAWEKTSALWLISKTGPPRKTLKARDKACPISRRWHKFVSSPSSRLGNI
jgi:hypothetical protein